jgi:hypothetical protein
LRVGGDAAATLQNSIVATNSLPQCSGSSGNINTSYSLIGDFSCGWPAPAGGNVIGVDPKLSALASRGGGNLVLPKQPHIGATRVQALLPGSPAIDSAANKFCTATDQLGTTRPIDGDGDGKAFCDMGAFEYQPPGGGGKPR